jgi:hypothetical protein
MDSFVGLITIAALMTVFDVLAMHFGVDSRETVGDDWTRSWSR